MKIRSKQNKDYEGFKMRVKIVAFLAFLLFLIYLLGTAVG